MSGKSGAVKAGQAYAELSIKDRMSPALDAAKKRFESFAKGMAAAGAWVTAAGSLIVGGISAALAASIGMAGELQDMSDRTGVAADALSELAFAAELTGASLDSLEAALRGMSKFTFAVSKGNQSAAKTLSMLGISARDFLAATPTEKLGMIADGLAKIKDPSLRSALAMATLGKSGTALIPMLSNGSAGLQQMIDRAHRLGIVLDKDAVAKLDDLGDELSVLKAQGRASLFAVASALVGPLTQIVSLAQEAAAGVIEFTKNNAGLVRVVALLGVGLLLVGTAMVGIAGAAALAGMAMSGLSSALALASSAAAMFGSVVAALKVVLAPELLLIYGAVLLVATALGVGVYAWMAWTESGQAAASGTARAFEWLYGVVTTTIGGISDAIMAGDWGLAFEILVKSMEVVWLVGLQGFEIAWQGFVGFLSDSWTSAVGAIKMIFASILPTAVSVLDSIQQVIVSWVNAIAELLHLELRVDGIDALTKLNADVQQQATLRKQEIATETKTTIEANRKARDAKVAEAGAAVKTAREELDVLAKTAEERRAGQAAKARKPRDPSQDQGGGLVAPETAGGVLGTFSASVAGLLGRSSPDVNEHAKKTAENTGEMKDLLEELLGKADGGLVFE